MKIQYLFYVLPVLLLIKNISCVTDSLNRSRVLKDGDTIISAGGSFELGFFSRSASNRRYLGIWYKNISEHNVVWVANREAPLINTAGFLEIIQPGILVLRNETSSIIWSSNSSTAAEDPVAQLLDNGNLVVKDANVDDPGKFLWQSFDYPTDTLLPGMKLGRNFVTGLEVYLSSWKSSEDPAPEVYTYHCDPTGYPQNFIKSGSSLVYRNGQWNGQGFSGSPDLTTNSIFSYEVVFDTNETYYTYNLLGSTITRFTLFPGFAQRLRWDIQSSTWKEFLIVPSADCGTYGLCGSNSVCDSATCRCLEKFKTKSHEGIGCIRNKPLEYCASGDGFWKYSNLKLPDTHNSTYDRFISLKKCKTMCLKNCSCTAYSSLDVRNGGSGCLLWYGDLVDMTFLPGDGQDIYIRLASSEFGKNSKLLIKILPLSIGVVLLGLALLLYIYRRKQKHLRSEREISKHIHEVDHTDEHHNEDIELPLFEYSRLVQATGNFSVDNKLGEGGYGPVYWGRLEEGQEVAVKRLSISSKQGVDEFKNEAICIAKLQHRNLVKLLGCCIERAENILIYEYMPNKSLDCFIFDQRRSRLLGWPERFEILQGVARGLLYLHQDSRLRIIHRDLKASNILLDADLHPKISDFGTARSYAGNETGDNTIRIVGTLGYMSPEYAGSGIFSIKSDVFSFGVLVLEIVSGKKNRMFMHEGHQLNLLGRAWMLNKEGRAMEIVDSNLLSTYCSSEVLRAIQVGLLCVQQCPEDRPDMSNVVNMLGNERPLPEAKQPGFFVEKYQDNAQLTFSTIVAR